MKISAYNVGLIFADLQGLSWNKDLMVSERRDATLVSYSHTIDLEVSNRNSSKVQEELLLRYLF